jgi:peptidoglycan/xylan/chitin deacetylase (PgdA/CDA1 family)
MVMYHYVRPVKNSKYPKLKALEFAEFRNQIKWFKKNFDIINFDDLTEILNKQKILGKKKLILTFDDGYKDHYEYVLPELKKNKLTGFFYPPSKVVEHKTVLDVNKIHFILEKEEDKKKILNDINFLLKKYSHKNIFDMKIDIGLLKSRYDNFETTLIKKLLQILLPEKIRQKILNNLVEKYLNLSVKDFSKKLYINSKELVEMYKDGMHIGSHGEFHHRWGTLSKNKQLEDINNSINFFKKLNLDIKKLSVCYPHGSYNKDTLKIINKVGFNFGLTTDVGIISNKNLKNNFAFPRLNANDFLNL